MVNDAKIRSRAAFAEGGAALVDLTQRLTRSADLPELERAFRRGFAKVIGASMHGFYVLDQSMGGPREIAYNVGVNVSELFVARYRAAMDVDPLLRRAQQTAGPVYNRELMGAEEWEETEVYRRAYSTHEMRHVVEVPIVAGEQVLGALHFGASGTDQNYTPADMRLAEAVANVLAIAIGGIHDRERRERALHRALAALKLTATAIVFCEPPGLEPEPNHDAKALLREIVDGRDRLPALLVSGGQARFTRSVEVQLHSGQSGSLTAHSQCLADGGLVSVLELRREHPSVDRSRLVALTQRESEVALLVVEGLTDREIADELILSRYTVQQHVKRIYRALGVDSRMALTRLLLGGPVPRGE